MNEWLNTQDGRSRLGFGLIVLGAIFLFNQWFGWGIGGNLWPLIVIAPGAVFLYLAVNGDEQAAGFAYPGAIIAGTGLILFFQNLTNHWESWSYVWALYPGFVGLAMQFEGKRRGKRKQLKTGREMVRWSAVAFAIGFVFFELIIFGNFSGLAVLLLGAGAVLVMMSRREALSDDYPKVKTPTNGMTYANGTAKRKHDETPII